MGALSVILLITFVIASLLIIFLVLLQNEEGDSIGGLFAGGSNSAFGSRSGNVLTKSTYILVTIFFVSSFILAVLNKTSSAPTEGIIKEGQEIQKENATPWYDDEKKDENASGEKSDENSSDSSSPAEKNENDSSDGITSENDGIKSDVADKANTEADVVADTSSQENKPSAESNTEKTE